MLNNDNYKTLQELIQKFNMSLQYADKHDEDCIYVHFTRDELREELAKLQTI